MAAAVVLYAGAELVWEWRTTRLAPPVDERVSNIVALVVGEALRLATLPLRFAVFSALATFAPFTLPSAWWTLLACYVLVDLLLYVLHRLMHETRIGWACHSVHHTSGAFELSLGGRVNWVQRLVDDFFYLPLVLLGFSPALVLFALELNRSSQYWTHTKMLGRLGIIDFWLNTPSNHRVHHYAVEGGPRRNYGSNFMVWDHLFGTYQREGGPHPFGTDFGPLGSNPLRIQFEGFRRFVTGRLS